MKMRFASLILVFALIIPFSVFAEAPLTPSLELIQKGIKLNKCGIQGTSIEFCAEDFLKITGKDFDYLTVTSLPPLNSGVLKLAGIDVLKGQSISKKALNHLEFSPSSEGIEKASFCFSIANSEFETSELECDLHYFGSLNFAPVVNSSNFETYENVTVNGILEVYDPEGDQFTLSLESYPQKGTVTLSSDGSFIYSPIQNLTGKDSFVYSATDEYGNRSLFSTVTVEVQKNSSGIHFADMKGKASHMAAIRLSEAEIAAYKLIGDSFYFSPEEKITRADFTVMLLSSTEGNLKSNLQNLNIRNAAVFEDISHLSEGRQKFITTATELGFVEAGTKFRPLAPITKAEAAEMLSKVLEKDSAEIKTTYYLEKFKGNNRLMTKEDCALLLAEAFL